MSCHSNIIVRVTYPKNCCPEVNDSQQLLYNGPALECVDVQTNQAFNEAIKEIDALICQTLDSLTTAICFTHTGEGFPIVNCNVAPEPGLVNGKLYYKAVINDCVTQFNLGNPAIPYYVWFSTSGTYTNQWVLSPLNDSSPENTLSYLPTSSSSSYPIGAWTITGVSGEYLITNSALTCPEPLP
jgi:hypothetical protein